MADIDKLSISIATDTASAVKNIDALVNRVGKLSTTLGKIDTKGLQKLSSGVSILANSMKSLENVKLTDFTRLSKGIQKLQEIDGKKLSSASSGLKPFADSMRVLGNTTFDNKNILSFISGIKGLANANLGNLKTADFAGLGRSISAFSQEMAGAAQIPKGTSVLISSLARLAKTGDKSKEVSKNLPALGRSLKSLSNDLALAPQVSKSTIELTQAIAQLSNAGQKSMEGAKSLDYMSKELLKAMQTLSKAPAIKSSVVNMADSLGRIAKTGSSAGKAATSLGWSFSSFGKASSSFGKHISNSGSLLRGFGKNIRSPVQGVKSLTSSLLSVAGVAGGFYAAFQGIRSSIDLASDLTEVQNVVDVTFGDMADKVDKFAETSIQKLGMSELTVKEVASRFQAMGVAMNIDTSSIENANKFLNKQTGGYIGLSDSMSDVSLNLTKLTADMASFYNVEQKDVAEDLTAIFTGQTRPLRAYGLDLTQATLQEWAMKQGLDANVKSMSQAEKTMLRYQYVLANSKAAQGDFIRTSNSWHNQLVILHENLKNIGKTIGGTLINALKPLVKAINLAMLQINEFAKTISNALGKIFGWTYEEGGGGAKTEAQDYADSMDGVADSTAKAADEQKEFNKQLQGFDKLNNLTTSDTGSPASTGAGGGTSGASGAGELGGQWKQGKSIIKEFESDIDSLKELGAYISSALTDAMNKIDWNAIYKKAEGFGRGLANFLNGLINPQLFSALGKTVAGSLNTALHFLDSFGTTFDWKNFGKSIGSGINSFARNFDWKLSAKTFNTFTIGILDALIAATKKVNWKSLRDNIFTMINGINFPKIGWKLGKLLSSLSSAVYDLVSKKTAWKELASNMANGINNFLLGNNWATTGKAISSGMVGILTMVKTAISTLNWAGIGQAIVNFISGIDWGGIVWNLSGMVISLQTGMLKVLGGAIAQSLVNVFGIKYSVSSIKLQMSEQAIAQAKQDIQKGFSNLKVSLSNIDLDAEEKVAELDVLGEEFFKLSQKEALTKQEAQRLKELYGKLVQKIPELKNNVLEHTKAYTGTKNELKKLIDKTKEYYLLQAAEEKLKETAKTLYSARAKLNKAQEEYNKTLKTQQKYQSKIKELEEKRNYYQNVNYDEDKVLDYNKQIANYQQKLQETNNSLKTQSTNLKGAQKQYDKIDKTYEDISSDIKKMNGEVDKFGKQKATAKITVTSKTALEDMGKIDDKIKKIDGKIATIKAKGDTEDAKKKIKELEEKKKDLESKKATIKILGSNADANSKLDAIEKRRKELNGKEATIKAKGNIKNAHDELAKIEKERKALNGKEATIKSKVQVTWEEKYGGKTIKSSVPQNVQDWIVSQKYSKKASGGIFKNGKWKDVTKYDGGGFPDRGQMFVAREAGPELVGTIGGSTAVVNNDQIVASVSDGVYRGVANALVRYGNTKNGGDIVVAIDGNEVFRAVRNQDSTFRKRTGKSAFAY